MTDLIKLSKIVSHALRHEPESYGIQLTNEGWILISELRISFKNKSHGFDELQDEDIYEMVLTAKKQRHEIKDGMIRAIYGHSVEVNIDYPTTIPPAQLFHGTSNETLANILSEGLKPMNRLYVHLSTDKNIAHMVGSRKDKAPVIIKIKSIEAAQKGIKFYSAGKDTWLTEFIAPEFLVVD